MSLFRTRIVRTLFDHMRFQTLMIFLISLCSGFVFLLYSIPPLVYPYAIDPVEGSVLSVIRSLAMGNNVYQPYNYSAFPYLLAIYPPIYYSLVSLFIKPLGVVFWSGRLLSLLATIGSAFVIGKTVMLKTHHVGYSVLGGFVFLSLYPVKSWGALLRVDSLALFFCLVGLYVFLRLEAHPRKYLLTVPFLVLGLYTKHSTISVLLSIFTYLLWKNRKKGLLLISITGSISILLFFILNYLSSGGFLFSTVTANQSPFLLSDARWLLGLFLNHYQYVALIVLLSSVCFVLRLWRSNVTLSLFLLVSLLITLLTIGRVGANINYFLELSAASSLFFSVGLGHWRRNRLTAMILAILLVFLVKDTLSDHGELSWRLALRKMRHHADIVSFIQENTTDKSKLLSTNPGFLLNAKREVGLSDFFQFSLLRMQGKWSEDGLLRLIRKKKIDMIVIHKADMSGELLTPQMKDFILKYYEVGWTSDSSDWLIYVPKK